MSKVTNMDNDKQNKNTRKVSGKDTDRNTEAGIVKKKKAEQRNGRFFKFDHKYANICLYILLVIFFFFFNYLFHLLCCAVVGFFKRFHIVVAYAGQHEIF